MDELQRQNNISSNNLVNSIIIDLGNAQWDKSMVQINKSSNGAVFSKKKGADKDTVVIVPLLRENDEMVHSYIEAKVNNGISIKIIKDDSYRRLLKKNEIINKNIAEDQALIFMDMTRRVLGTEKFSITDKRLFSIKKSSTDSGRLPKIEFLSNNSLMERHCVQVTVEIECIQQYYAKNEKSISKDNIHIIYGCFHIYEKCGWYEGGGGNNGDGSDGGWHDGGGNNDGGGNTGSGVGTGENNDDPCNGGGLIINGVLPPSDCDGNEGPGWLPTVPEFDPLEGKQLAPDDFYVDHYWEDDSYDNNAYINPVVNNPSYDQEGYRKNGPVYNYYGGSVQNYTNDNGGKYAIFKKDSGEEIKFPGATITDFVIYPGAGVTTSNGGIHADLSFSLKYLQHEYGHYLQAKIVGSYLYNNSIAPASLWSATFFPSTHKSFWTETYANTLAIMFFGNNSDIALDPVNFPR